MTNTVMIPAEIAAHKEGDDAFDWLMQMDGKVFRHVKDRKTIQVNIGGKSYFIKQHFGVGWGEIAKNLTTFKRPVLGAMTEVKAIQKLNQLGIPTTPLVAYGERGSNPASKQSFVMTEDLGDIISLEELFLAWQTEAPAAEQKHAVIKAVAELSTILHGAGLCHRDFYLCHFVIEKSQLARGDYRLATLALIDLHRMLFNQPAGGNAMMKDIAGLYFSTLDVDVSDADYALFKANYLPQSDAFWHKVKLRAQKLHAKFHSKKFQAKVAEEREKVD